MATRRTMSMTVCSPRTKATLFAPQSRARQGLVRRRGVGGPEIRCAGRRAMCRHPALSGPEFEHGLPLERSAPCKRRVLHIAPSRGPSLRLSRRLARRFARRLSRCLAHLSFRRVLSLGRSRALPQLRRSAIAHPEVPKEFAPPPRQQRAHAVGAAARARLARVQARVGESASRNHSLPS